MSDGNDMADVSVTEHAHLDEHVRSVAEGADAWARSGITERTTILREIRGRLPDVIDEWVELSARAKQIPTDSPLVGEEWLSGPYALVTATDQLIATLEAIDAGTHLDSVRTRTLANGQIAVDVVPSSHWDRLLLNGVSAEVWMRPGVTHGRIADDAGSSYAEHPTSRSGRVAVVLGAGNINSIAPLDCYHKLFTEHAAVVLKLNPVNEYLAPLLDYAFGPLIDRDALRVVTGDSSAGEYLVTHPAVDEIHITGSEVTHDAIVWGVGEDGERNKRSGTPLNDRPITSELGAVCPTIVVPGPWNAADLQFQAEHIATQKLHNNGHNCVACQVLVMPRDWEHSASLRAGVERELRNAPARGMYYPGTADRLDRFGETSGTARELASPGAGLRRVVVDLDVESSDPHTEVFGPGLGVVELPGDDPASYLAAAVEYCNEDLRGTLGANVLIHPDTVADLGERFEELLLDLRYGCIAVNGWTGMGFLLTVAPWGAFPGHTLDDVGSGLGFVHNTSMLEQVERTVVTAPFHPFPRSVRHGKPTLLPKPPWFVTHKRAAEVGELLTRFQLAPSLAKVPRLFAAALRG